MIQTLIRRNCRKCGKVFVYNEMSDDRFSTLALKARCDFLTAVSIHESNCHWFNREKKVHDSQ
jgi:hypothetical protein